MITTINLEKLTEDEKRNISAEADLVSTFYHGLRKLYPNATLDEMSSNVEITLNVKVTASDVYPSFKNIKFDSLRIVNNGINYSKEYV